jgi:hypothetical protein
MILKMKRDAVWAEMSAAAQLLSDQYCKGDSLRVTANRRATGLLTVSEGLAVQDNWTDVFEPVRKRRIYRNLWNDVQTLEQAARHIEVFLRERPDQAPIEHDS